MADEAAHVTFVAAFPPIQCIKFLGDGGARIVLDIPQSDEWAVESLRQWRDRLLMVTVVPMARDACFTGENSSSGAVAEGTKRESRWETAET
jgi:hypothetical protein